MATRPIKCGHYVCDYVTAPARPITEPELKDLENEYDADGIGKLGTM